MTMINDSSDIHKLNELRVRMLLTIDSVCVLLGITRTTYYGWLKGKPQRKTKAAKLRKTIRALAACVTHHAWPSPEVFGATQDERLAMIQRLIVLIDENQPEASNKKEGANGHANISEASPTT